MTDRPVPERPVPDRDGRDRDGGDEGFVTRARADDYGMTRTALALLVFMMLVFGWRVYEFWDGRQPPAGVATQEATVLGFQSLDRAGAGDSRNALMFFELPDGTQESALYEKRWIGEAEKGDTVTAYHRDDRWRVTSEKSVGGLLWWVTGLVLLLSMTYGWFHVRVRVRRGEGPR